MIHELFKLFTWMGSEWVLWTLFGLSVLTIWVILQRWTEIRRLTRTSDRFWNEQGEKWLRSNDASALSSDIEKLQASYPCLETETLEVIQRSVKARASDPSQIVAAFLDQRRLKLERFVSILGTIGSNAPFVGLLGTVLGIIRAFHEMSTSGIAGMENMSGGIAEALVATAIGLLVAIPAVVFFNILNKRIGILIRRSQNLSMLALGERNETEKTAERA